MIQTGEEKFSMGMKQHLGTREMQLAAQSLPKLQQYTTVLDYQQRFEELYCLVDDVDEQSLLQTFLEGLREEIRHDVTIAEPQSLFEVFKVALRYEAKHAKGGNRSSMAAEKGKFAMHQAPFGNEVSGLQQMHHEREDPPSVRVFKSQNVQIPYLEKKSDSMEQMHIEIMDLLRSISLTLGIEAPSPPTPLSIDVHQREFRSPCEDHQQQEGSDAEQEKRFGVSSKKSVSPAIDQPSELKMLSLSLPTLPLGDPSHPHLSLSVDHQSKGGIRSIKSVEVGKKLSPQESFHQRPSKDHHHQVNISCINKIRISRSNIQGRAVKKNNWRQCIKESLDYALWNEEIQDEEEEDWEQGELVDEEEIYQPHDSSSGCDRVEEQLTEDEGAAEYIFKDYSQHFPGGNGISNNGSEEVAEIAHNANEKHVVTALGKKEKFNVVERSTAAVAKGSPIEGFQLTEHDLNLRKPNQHHEAIEVGRNLQRFLEEGDDDILAYSMVDGFLTGTSHKRMSEEIVSTSRPPPKPPPYPTVWDKVASVITGNHQLVKDRDKGGRSASSNAVVCSLWRDFQQGTAYKCLSTDELGHSEWSRKVSIIISSIGIELSAMRVLPSMQHSLHGGQIPEKPPSMPINFIKKLELITAKIGEDFMAGHNQKQLADNRSLSKPPLKKFGKLETIGQSISSKSWQAWRRLDHSSAKWVNTYRQRNKQERREARSRRPFFFGSISGRDRFQGGWRELPWLRLRVEGASVEESTRAPGLGKAAPRHHLQTARDWDCDLELALCRETKTDKMGKVMSCVQLI